MVVTEVIEVPRADFKLKGVLRLAEPFLGGTFKTLALKALAGLAAKLGAER